MYEDLGDGDAAIEVIKTIMGPVEILSEVSNGPRFVVPMEKGTRLAQIKDQDESGDREAFFELHSIEVITGFWDRAKAHWAK